MNRSQQPLFSRPDTFLGVCEGLGQDFGLNANLLRIIVGVGLLFAPVQTLAGYVGLAVVIYLSRWIFPTRRADVVQAVRPQAALKGHNDESATEFVAAA